MNGINGTFLHANPDAAWPRMNVGVDVLVVLCLPGFVSSMEDVDRSVLDLLAFHAKNYADVKSEYEELKTQARDPTRRVKSYEK